MPCSVGNMKQTSKRLFKRRIVDSFFDDPEIRTVVMDRFMVLAKVKFKA